AEQHAETHLVAIGERKLNRPGAFAEFEQGLDDVAALDASARVPHRALVDGAGFASNLLRFAPLHRVQLEAKPERAGAAEGLDAVGMKCAGAGAVSILALMASTRRSGRLTHSRQPILICSFWVRRASIRGGERGRRICPRLMNHSAK